MLIRFWDGLPSRSFDSRFHQSAGELLCTEKASGLLSGRSSALPEIKRGFWCSDGQRRRSTLACLTALAPRTEWAGQEVACLLTRLVSSWPVASPKYKSTRLLASPWLLLIHAMSAFHSNGARGVTELLRNHHLPAAINPPSSTLVFPQHSPASVLFSSPTPPVTLLPHTH